MNLLNFETFQICAYLELVCHLVAIDSEAEQTRGGVTVTANQKSRSQTLALLLLVAISVLQISR